MGKWWKYFFDNIKADAIVKYDNICENLKKNNRTFEGKSQVNSSSFAKENDSDKEKIIALTSQLEKTQQQFLTAYASNFNPDNQSSTSNFKSGGKRKPNVAEWRMKQTFGP